MSDTTNSNVSTRLVHAGRGMSYVAHSVNPPVYRASTFVFNSMAEMEAASQKPFRGSFYGRNGTPTTVAFEDAMAELEGAHGAIATSSGVSAIMGVFFGLLKSGEHVLIPDSVYDIVRRSSERLLKKLDIEYEYYDPALDADIEALIKENTRLIYMESPGSGTFDVQDVPAIVAVAKKHGIRTAIDNTWATPLLFRPLDLGVDAVVEACTKYVVGHSDAMLGLVATNSECFLPIRQAIQDMGACAGTEEVNLGLRGLRTMEVRLQRHQESALTVARWFESRPEVERVLYPALESFPGHAVWKRDFGGASGLFSVELKPVAEERLHAMIDGLKLFKLGYSWGGFESLVLPAHPEKRQVAKWSGGPVVRFHVGLEQPDDLIADLAQALKQLA